MARAKTVKGVLGNLKFITGYATWATLVVFLAGVVVGVLL